jgi:hypothetical protein
MINGRLIRLWQWDARERLFLAISVTFTLRLRAIVSGSFKLVESKELELLVRLDEGQKHLIDRLESIEDRIRHAEEGRSKLHDRLNVQQEDIFVVGSIVAQQRDFIKMLAQTIEDNNNRVSPALAQWNEIKTLGKWVSIGLTGVGITGAVMLLAVKSWVLSVLAWIKP